MSSKSHITESQGAKARDHLHPRHHFWKHAHRDWRLWTVVVFMVALILVYVITDNFSLRPGKHSGEQLPAVNMP